MSEEEDLEDPVEKEFMEDFKEYLKDKKIEEEANEEKLCLTARDILNNGNIEEGMEEGDLEEPANHQKSIDGPGLGRSDS